jgi:predicted aspartyl protease
MIKYFIPLLIIISKIPPVHSQEAIETIPFHLAHKLIFIQLIINDSEITLDFLFDTGAGITVLNAETAHRIQLKTTDQASVGTAGKTIEAQLSSGNRIKIGKDLVLDDITLALMDLSHISKYLNTNIDGIIGSDLLQKLVTEVRAEAKVIRFYPPTGFDYEGKGTALELIGLEAGHWGIPIEIISKRKSSPLNLIVKIDSGADNFLTFHNEAVNKYNLLDSKKRHKVKKGFGADPTITYNLSGQIHSAKFCRREWKNIPVVFEVDPLNANSKRLADGLIGQEMLLNFNITYDINKGLIYFENAK